MNAALVVALFIAAVTVQSPRGRADCTLAGETIVVDYGRPSLNGRDMKSLLKVGYTWRLGADEATRIELSHAVRFKETKLDEGAYSLFVKRLDENAWALVFNSETGQWGT